MLRVVLHSLMSLLDQLSVIYNLHLEDLPSLEARHYSHYILRATKTNDLTSFCVAVLKGFEE